MGGLVSPVVHLLPTLMGVVGYIAVHHLWLWLGRRRDPLHLWVAAWSAATLLYLGSHYVQGTAVGPEAAALGGRLTWTSGLALIFPAIGLGHGLVGLPVSRRLMASIAMGNAVLLAVLWSSDLVITSRTYLRTDALGYQYVAPVPGPLMLLLVPCVAAAFVYGFWVLRAAPLDAGELRAIRWGFAVYAAFALNDLLHAARVIQSIRLFDFAFVAVAVGLTYMVIRRHNRLQSHLEEEVAARTRELSERQVELEGAHRAADQHRQELAALLRAAQTVMAGLDLEATLGRIIDEASRIAGTPHVAVLLVDPDAGVLRLGAGAGAPLPPGFQVPLGASYSGQVARTGQALFVPDTLSDPAGLRGERDRAQGLRTYLGLPIKTRDRVLGVLTFSTGSPREYGPSELASLASFADIAAIAIDNARLYGEATRREKRLITLAALTRSLTATLSLDDLLSRVVRQAVELVGGSTARLWLVEDGGESLALRAHAGAGGEVSGVSRMRVGEGLMGQIVATRAPLVIGDLERYPGRKNAERHRAEGTVSFAGVPLMLGDRALGALGIGVRERHAFGDEEMGLLQSLASHAAIALESARLYEAASTQTRELTALHDVRTALASTLDLRTVLEAIADWAVRLIGAQGSAVFEFDQRDELLHPRTVRGLGADFPMISLKLGQGGAGAAVLARKPVWSADVRLRPLPGYEDEALGQQRPLGDVIRELPYRALLAVPIIGHDEILGAVTLVWGEVHSPDEREVRLLLAFAQHAAVALENARLYDELEARLRRLETLTRLNRLISSSLDSKRVLQEISRSAAQLMDVPVASFWLADEPAGTLELVGFSDPSIEAGWPSRTTGFDAGVIGWVATHRRALHLPDVAADPRVTARDWLRAHGLSSFYGVPVVHEGELLAVLGLNGRQPFRLGPEAESLLQGFVAQAAVAIRNASLYEAEGRARREAEVALAQVKQLQGMLPICAYCKKIRNDRNYWEAIETYIGERSQATFSHGICPDCRSTVVAAELAEFRRRQGQGA